jgi:hypothetical protein
MTPPLARFGFSFQQDLPAMREVQARKSCPEIPVPGVGRIVGWNLHDLGEVVQPNEFCLGRDPINHFENRPFIVVESPFP